MAPELIASIHIGEFKASDGAATMAVYGLGSCVALVLFEPVSGVGGLAHVLLPGPRPPHDTTADLPAKYGCEALDALKESMEALGADPSRLRAALVGGARLFAAAQEVDNAIGARNVEALKTCLKSENIPLDALETGGNEGRTVFFRLPGLKLEVKTLRGGRRAVPLGDPRRRRRNS